MKRSSYKKKSSGICNYCDYLVCGKGHRCKWYKKMAKNFKKGKKNLVIKGMILCQ